MPAMDEEIVMKPMLPTNKQPGIGDSDLKDEACGRRLLSYLTCIRYFSERKTYRRKVIFSFCLLWCFVVLGWLEGQLGSSLLDLQIVSRTTLEKASSYISFHSIGYLIGSLVSGVLFDRYNKILLLVLILLCNSATVAAIPWCILFELMATMHVVRGFFGGGLDACGNALILFTWGEKSRSFMQALHFAFAFGGILSPMATAPFLLSVSNDGENNLTTTINSVNFSETPEGVITNNATMVIRAKRPRLFIAYSLSGSLCLSAAIFLSVHYITGRINKKTTKKTQEESASRINYELSFVTKAIIIIFLCCFIGVYCAIEDTFHGMLTAFVVTQMEWTKQNAAFLTSIFWASFGCSRFLAIFFVDHVKPLKLLLIFLTFMMVVYVGLLFTAIYMYDPGLWICIPLAGIAKSIVFPTIFSLTEENLFPVTGKISSALLVAASLGIIINPLVVGNLMEALSPLYYCYIILAESVLLFCLWFILFVIVRHIKLLP